ncbi:MAG: DUF3592 domain-containing protein [Phycisphaerae bacterium]|nr:DUF3592 domain-containing protein [Phycisphaerae bacterium]
MTTFTTFSIAGPPRSVPLLVRLRLLFGGFSGQFGWFFFGFGMIFVWLFTCSADLTGWYIFRGDLETAPGRITASRQTRMSVNDNPVWEYAYTFTAPDGQTCEGTSCKTGGGDRANGKVQIEFPKGRPQTSRIHGMSRKPMGLFGLFPVLFPAVGLCFIASATAKGTKGIRLLRDGHPGAGRLIAKEPTNTKINDQTVYRLTFEFTSLDGRKYNASAKTHLPAILEDEPEEPLLYDPSDPACAVMLDDLPGAPRIDEYGQVRTAAPLAALKAVIIPAAAIIGHGAYLYLRYRPH